jgi:hypothetical protein
LTIFTVHCTIICVDACSSSPLCQDGSAAGCDTCHLMAIGR